MKKLKKDTNVADFGVEVSPSNKNVNIRCSAGFYTKVVIPSFDQLAAGSCIPVDNITVKCQDVTKRTDATGAATTTVIMFRMSQHQLSLGQVTVHLHHTSRNIQIQGSALLSDNMKAPVWFLDNVPKERLNQLSKTKAHDISIFNRSVGEMVTKHLEQVNTKAVCAGCQAYFNGRSSPEYCSGCKLYYHKYKCYQSASHSCHVKKRTMSFTYRGEDA